MTDLDEDTAALRTVEDKIATVEAEIAKYRVDYDNVKTIEQRTAFAVLIASRRDTLNKLLDEKKDLTRGKPIGSSQLS
jgi:alanine-alpha-ketoisovalerate/valine-pyruvate aminotransferase